MGTKSIARNLHDANEAGVNLLLTDAQIAMTLLDAAETTTDPAGRLRKIGEAKKAHDTILHLVQNLTLDEAQAQVLDERMTVLRKRLIKVGALKE